MTTHRRRTTLGSHLPVMVAAALIAVSLTGARLYASSTASAALAQQRRETCADQSALTLPILPGRPDADATARAIGDVVPLMAEPRRGAISRPQMASESALPRRLTLISLDDAGQHVEPPLRPLGPDEIAVSASNLSELSKRVGDQIDLKSGRVLTITQSFDDVPFSPIPDFWCGHPELFELTNGGDLPPPFAIASFDTVVEHDERLSVFDTYRVTPHDITLTEAHEVERGYRQAATEFERAFRSEGLGVERNEWSRVVQRAASVHTTVQRNLAPVLLIALLADAIVLVAAAVLVARERRRELRILAVRGVHPAKVTAYVAPPLAASVAIGSLIGFLVGWIGVWTLGPSSLLEQRALATAAVSVAAGAVLATALVSMVVAAVADRYADPRPARVGSHVPLVLVLVGFAVLAIVSFRRLDELGGVRTSGVLSSGGDLVAMGFPLFGLLAVIGVVGGAVAAITPRLRLTGGGLRRSVRLGWRRVVLEAAPLAAILVSVALAAGCFTVAASLFAGAERQLHDKAEVYVGADLSVVLFGATDVPSDWADRTTLMSRVRAKTDGPGIDVLGVDLATFGSVARMRSDGADRSLTELLATLSSATTSAPADNGEIPAIAVGSTARPGDTVSARVPGNPSPVTLRVVSTANFFPSKSSGAPMFVVKREALDAVVPFPSTMLLMSDPPSDALQQLRDGGARMGLVRQADQAFDGSAYSALRWAYVPLAALGTLFVAVALAMQLLVVSARQEQRRIAHAVMVRTGFDRRSQWVAAMVEIGVPLAVGTVVGVAGALVTSRLAIERLDPLPGLDPPAQFLFPWLVVATVALAIPLWTVLIAWSVVRSTERGDPMRVFQGAG